jgi:hypothetical protein
MSGLLAHSPADVIGQLLVALGLGTDPTAGGAWPVYVSDEPDSPDSCLTVFDTSARDRGRLMATGQRVEMHGFQVRVRSTTHPVGYTKARAVAVALDEDVYQTAVTLGGHVYMVHSVSRSSDVIPLGKELPRSERSIFTINATGTIRMVS